MNNITRTSLWAGTKLAIAGATLVAIGWSVITFYPSTGVKQSEADVYWGSSFKRTSTQKFASTLQELGHEAPRSYDYNGNTVFFSARTTTQSPAELLVEYQRAFTRSGVNERPYLEASEDGGPRPQDSPEQFKKLTDERGLAQLSGQLVPSVINDDYVMMSGGLIKGEPTTCKAAEAVLEKNLADGLPFEDLFQAYRAVEIMRSADDPNVTYVTASWSDTGLDIRKHHPDEASQFLAASADTNVPSCPGCQRLTRFAGSGREDSYITNVFESPQHYTSVTNFYLEAMKNRGWRETDASALTRQALEHTDLRDMPQQAIQLVRGEEFLTVSIEPTESGSIVTTMTAD